MDFLNSKRMPILMVNDKKGLIVARKGFAFLPFSGLLKIEIQDDRLGVQVAVNFERWLGLPDFGRGLRLEREVIERLKEDI
jgi:hypothetical protein